MNARHLASLVAVAEHGSLAAAARAVGLSHSAISLHIKALEEEFGAALLDRSRKPPALTARGATLVERARKLLGLMAEIRELGSRAGLVGRLALGVAPSALTHLAPPALSALQAAHPGLTLQLETGLSADLVGAVRAGRLDAAIGTLPEENPPQRFDALVAGLSVRRIVREPLIAIGPVAAEEREAEALLSSRPFIWFSRRTWAGAAIEKLVAARGYKIEGGWEVDSIEAVEAMVRQGLGVSITPQRAGAPPSADLKRLPLSGAGTGRALGFYARLDNAEQTFIEELFAAFAKAARQPG